MLVGWTPTPAPLKFVFAYRPDIKVGGIRIQVSLDFKEMKIILQEVMKKIQKKTQGLNHPDTDERPFAQCDSLSLKRRIRFHSRQLASSESSVQSAMPSHRQPSGTHLPVPHRNCPGSHPQSGRVTRLGTQSQHSTQ